MFQFSLRTWFIFVTGLVPLILFARVVEQLPDMAQLIVIVGAWLLMVGGTSFSLLSLIMSATIFNCQTDLHERGQDSRQLLLTFVICLLACVPFLSLLFATRL